MARAGRRRGTSRHRKAGDAAVQAVTGLTHAGLPMPQNAPFCAFATDRQPTAEAAPNVQLCACALIVGQRDVFAPGVRTSSASVAFPVLNDS